MSQKEKSQSELRKEALFRKQKHTGLTLSPEQIAQADTFCEGYKQFLQQVKTERAAVSYFIRAAENRGFVRFDPQQHYQAGSRVYVNNRGKALLLAVIGTRPMAEGVRIAAAHIDSPRLDLKPNPLYEEHEMAYFKTHYYGGIKKYQWTAMPLSLHGRVMKKDGTAVDVCIGEDATEPKFCVTDLLPHLAGEQMKKPMSEAIKGEELNILIGSRPFRDEEGSELVKLQIMQMLHDRYGIVEEDFLCAELEAVPAFPACDIGFDRSMIGAYGQDDRVCAYPSAQAALDVNNPAYTVITVLADKEEVGSDGNTGLNSAYLRYFIEDLAAMQQTQARHVLSRSKCLSADVNAGFDPTFPEVLEKKNAAFLNYGVVVTKYTGSRGKGDTSDASAEWMGQVRVLLDKASIPWQTGELGRVDLGGGGTVAKYIAALNVDVVDVGVPVLSMHSPFEVVSKLDVYHAYKAFMAFFHEAF